MHVKIIEKHKEKQCFLIFVLFLILCISKHFFCLFGIVLDPVWSFREPLGAPRGGPEDLLGRLGPPICSLGAPLRHVCRPHGASWSILGPLGAARAPLLGVLARFLSVSGARFRVPQGFCDAFLCILCMIFNLLRKL